MGGEDRKGYSSSDEGGHRSSEVSALSPGKGLDISDNRHRKDVVKTIL